MSSNAKIILAIIIGMLLGGIAMSFLGGSAESGLTQKSDSVAKKPLYWVAPMDSNYRRDKPGKSPMGMDLIPVYAEDATSNDQGPGAIKIQSHVINNLGIRTTKVEIKSLHSEIQTVGYVQYDEDKLIHIHPRVDGWVEKLFVKSSGDPVNKGQPLYTLYSPQLVNAQEELLIALKRGNRSLINAAKARLESLQLSEKFIETLVKVRQVQQNITFYSPQSGVVDDLKVREGFYVKPGSTLMSIGQLESIWVEAEVFERDAGVIVQGLPVTMRLDYLPGKVWTGEVDYIYPTLNSKTRTLRVRVKFENPDLTLKPSMFAQVSIQVQRQQPTIIVPKEAVIRTGSQDRVVLSLGEGQFKSIAVKIGRVTSSHIEILDGLVEGDEIVTSAQFLIDSESSKTSDFVRMSHDEQPLSGWAQGDINEVKSQERLVNITHGPIDAWNMPGMTMNFEVSDLVDINQLRAGQNLHFELEKTDTGMFSIIGIHIMSETEQKAQHEKSVNTTEPEPASGQGEIIEIDTENRMLKIAHGPLEAWDMPGMTMNFTVDTELDMSVLSKGQSIHFEVNRTDEGFLITLIHVMPFNEENDNDTDRHQH